MQDCIRNVDTKAVITVRIKFAILLIVSRFIKIHFYRLIIRFYFVTQISQISQIFNSFGI